VTVRLGKVRRRLGWHSIGCNRFALFLRRVHKSIRFSDSPVSREVKGNGKQKTMLNLHAKPLRHQAHRFDDEGI
jgi:hypothetical protein